MFKVLQKYIIRDQMKVTPFTESLNEEQKIFDLIVQKDACQSYKQYTQPRS